MAAPPPPAAWPRYFEDDHAPDDRRAALVDELIAFFTSDAGAAFLDGGAARAVGGIALALDHSALVAAAGSPDLVASLEVQPDEGLACLACAAHEVRGEGGGWTARCGLRHPARRPSRPRTPANWCALTTSTLCQVVFSRAAARHPALQPPSDPDATDAARPDPGRAAVRLWNVATAVTSVGALRAASIGRLVSVTGSSSASAARGRASRRSTTTALAAGSRRLCGSPTGG